MDEEGREQRLKRALAPLRAQLRLHPDRLPAGAVAAHAQRADRRRLDPRADAVRVLRAGRPERAARHDRGAEAPAQPGAGDRRRAAHHVRRAQQPRQRGVGRTDQAFRRQGVPHHRAAQRAPGRGAQPRPEHRRLRQGLARRRSPTSAWPAKCCAASANASRPRKAAAQEPTKETREHDRRARSAASAAASKPCSARRPPPKPPPLEAQPGEALRTPAGRRSCSRASTSRAPAWTPASSPSWPSRSRRRA